MKKLAKNDLERPARTPGGEPSVDAAHTPFRAWALQQDLESVIGQAGVLTWGSGARDSDDGLGASGRSGQAFLREALAPDPDYSRRAHTGTLMLALALVLNVLSLYNPLDLRVAGEGVSQVSIVISAVALAAALLFLQRIPHRWFIYLEQALLMAMFAVVVMQVSGTGGARSPLLTWTINMVIYSAYFQPRNWVVFNATVATGVLLAPLVYTAGGVDGYDIVVSVLLVAVVWALAISVSRSRGVARNANSAVEFLALGDPLTGVANLRAYNRFAAEIAARGDAFALVVFDMRGLRGANTVFGYDVGDEMLDALARILRSACGERDQVARIGGDEFAVLMPGADADAAKSLLRRFDQARSTHNERVRSHSPRISVYKAAATFPADGDTPDAVRGVADSRMLAQRSRSVPAVWDIDETRARRAQMLVEKAPPARSAFHEPGAYAAAYALLVAAVMSLWLVLPDGDVPQRAATFVLMLFTYAVAAIAFWGRGINHNAAARTITDVAVIAAIAPAMSVTGGWRSPLQAAVILVVAFFAQFYRGNAAIWRIGAAIFAYALAFWTSGAVSEDGQSLFQATVVVGLTVGGVMFVNGRSIDAAQDVVHQAARRDPLTGIPNVYAFRADLETLIARSREHPAADRHRPCLLIADVDDFHAVNMAGGHPAGDQALSEVAVRLQREAGDGRSVYRLGGDEFAMLATFEEPAAAIELAERCRRALSFNLADSAEPVTCSVGYSAWSPEMSAAQLVESVENALAAISGERSKSVAGDPSIWL